MPLLESALSALNTLTKADITEVKSMKSPPAPVKVVMEAVCQMLGIKPKKVRHFSRVILFGWTLLAKRKCTLCLSLHDYYDFPASVRTMPVLRLKGPDFMAVTFQMGTTD